MVRMDSGGGDLVKIPQVREFAVPTDVPAAASLRLHGCLD